jgi:hypothetical protein
MEYNKNFNKCEMAKYLIINAKNYVTNGTKIKIGEFISEFQYPDFNTVLDVDRFITFNERFDVTINGITYKEILPYYVMFIEKTNGFPGDGFYDAFKTQNSEVYNQITSSHQSNKLTSQQMHDIEVIAKDALHQHISLKFQKSDDIDIFITTEMIYEGRCHKEILF